MLEPVRQTDLFRPARSQLPADAAFYSVEIGHRGGLNYSKAELSGKAWTVGLSIGS